MKIYTKSGDQGDTSLWGGQRVKKCHPRVVTYGTLDEANSMLGLALTFVPTSEGATIERLTQIQHDLFTVGSELATPAGQKTSIQLLGDEAIQRLEAEIDAMEAILSPLQNFILPGGSSAGATLHLARTIVRRAERECVDLKFNQNEAIREEVIRYLNRLSDYLFVAARFVNHHTGKSEAIWVAPKK